MKKKALIAFLISFPLTLILGNLVQKDTEALGGDAISGYVENEKYYIMIDDQSYKEVAKDIWIKNYILWVSTIVVAFIFIISMAISTIKYLIIPAISKF